MPTSKRGCYKDDVLGNVQLLATILHLAGSSSEYLFLASVNRQFKTSMPVLHQTSYKSVVQSPAHLAIALSVGLLHPYIDQCCFMKALARHAGIDTIRLAYENVLIFPDFFMPMLYKNRREHDIFIAVCSDIPDLITTRVLNLAIISNDHAFINLIYANCANKGRWISKRYIGTAIRRSQSATVKILVDYHKDIDALDYMIDMQIIIEEAETEDQMQIVADKISLLETENMYFPKRLFSLAADNSNIPLMRYLHTSGKCLLINYNAIRDRAEHYNRQTVIDFLYKDCKHMLNV